MAICSPQDHAGLIQNAGGYRALSSEVYDSASRAINLLRAGERN